MKKPLHEVAQVLHSHPATIIFTLASLGAPFEDIYPEVDESWIETLKGLDWKHSGPDKIEHKNLKAESFSNLSNTAKKIIDKLERKKHYGKNSISLDIIKNHYCRNQSGFEEAIEELIAIELIKEEAKGFVILNPSKNKEIAEVLHSFRQ
jgi:hypothetical protein